MLIVTESVFFFFYILRFYLFQLKEIYNLEFHCKKKTNVKLMK